MRNSYKLYHDQVEIGITSLDNSTYSWTPQIPNTYDLHRRIYRVETKRNIYLGIAGTVAMDKNCPWKDMELFTSPARVCGWGMRTDSNRNFRFILDNIPNQTENNNNNLNQGLPISQYTFSQKVETIDYFLNLAWSYQF